VTIDCDGQDPVEVSIEMLKIMLATKSDVVFARRRMRSDSFFKRITAKYFYKLVYRNEDSNFFQNVADYRLMNSDFLAEFIKYSERNPYLRGIAANMGFRREFVDFDRPERIEGDSKYTIRKMFGLAFDGIFSFTAVPLRFIFFLSIFSISITLLAVIYAVCSYLFTSNVKAGWASIIVFISFFSSIIIFSLGVIGIYLEKIFQESKQRPAFHIQDAINCEFVDSRVNTNNGYTAL
jgi:dolichol-phosphate mannosyltransferase